MKRDPEGRVAIVTGASSGVGWAVAKRLAEAGVKLCVTARRRAPLQAVAREIERSGGECLVVPADVTDAAAVQNVADECARHYGRIDYLVNAAAVQDYARFEDYRWEEITRVLEVNLLGYMRFARAVLPHLRRRADGHIINIASMLSRGAAPLLSTYVASKHAILGWSQTLRLELYGSGIDVSAVLLPSVATPMFDHAPTHFGLQPRPVPPTYSPEVAAKAVARLVRRPKPTVMPVFIQGPVFLLAQKLARPLTDAVMARLGARIQTDRSKPIDRAEGNLFRPIAEGVGPRGSIPPTPLAVRTAGVAAALGAATFTALALRGVARWLA